MSLLADVYRQIAADPEQREGLHQAALDYRRQLPDLQLTIDGTALGISAMQGMEAYLRRELARLTAEAEAIEAALREVAQ